MGNRTNRWAKALAWCSTAIIGAMLPQAHAQTSSLRYAETARLQAPVGYLSYEATTINDAGEVGGYALKSGGKVWRLVVRDDPVDGLFPFFRLFRLPQWVSEDSFEAFPVVWKGGVPKVLPRYGSNYSTWILGTAGASGWQVATASVAGRLKPVESEPGSMERPLGSVPRTLTAAGVYSDVIPFVRFAFEAVKINDQGSILVDSSPDMSLTVAGQTSTFKLPDELVFRRMAGLSSSNMALIEGNKEPYRYLQRCFVLRNGQLTEIKVPAPEPVVSVNCGAMNKDGLVVGAILAWGPGGANNLYDMRRAIYSWKDDRIVFVTPFVKTDTSGFGFEGVTRDGVAFSSQGPDGTVVYPGGVIAPLGPLLNLSLRSDEYPAMLRVNDAGQILVKIVNSGGRPASFRVLSPR
jgi:hypothetical protein